MTIICFEIWNLILVDSGMRTMNHIMSYLDNISHWAGRSGLQMSTWPGTVIPRWRSSSSSRVEVSKASAFRFVSWTVCTPYPTQRTATELFQSPLYTDLEQSSAAYHICSITSHLLLSLEDILLWTLLPVITVVMPAMWHCHLWTR